ncbi:MAG: response regulator, partial [Acidobacteria bacterium]|nr:response regulator [Acidobacteriota bacterium]
RRLGKIVSVEGIETSTQRDLAIREGCDLGQGYFFGAPTTADSILNLLAPASAGQPEEQEKSDLNEEITLVSKKAPREISKNADTRMVTLVVDDDERMRNLMAILLRRIGHEVVTAEDGLKLLSRLGEVNQSQVQLIVLDLMMPKMSGWQVLEHLSESSPELLSRVLLITAAGSHEISKIDPRLYGVVLEKPFDHGDFYDAAAQCIKDGKAADGRTDEAEGSYLVH